MASPLDILGHTPVAVWAVLAALVRMGLRQTKTRTMSATRVWLVPALVGAASLASAPRGFADAGELLTGACRVVGAALGGVSDRPLDLPRRVSANADGSIAALLLFVGVFMVRCAVDMALAIQPTLPGNPVAAAARSRTIRASRGATGPLLSA